MAVFCKEDEHQQQKEKEKIDEELQLSDGSSPEPNSNEVIIPILKKNGPLLQSQWVCSEFLWVIREIRHNLQFFSI